VPRITNDTVAEHREEVLSSARKFIYPLQHSKHSVVRISLGLFVAVLAVFFIYCGLALYKFQATSGFMYGVTRVLPLPVARVGGHWVSYESYLFELRHNMHYYHTQQRADFSSRDGKVQLARLKQQAMSTVIQNAYIKQLANEHDVSVSSREVNNQVTLVRNQNRLGSNERVFKDVLKEFWGWSETDFKRELKQQLLQQKVVAKLDTTTNDRANSALKQLQGGADFASVATAMSDDASTKGNGGQYGIAIAPNDPNVAPAVTDTLFKMKPGQISGLVNTGYTVEILKVVDISGTSVHAAHIQFTYKDINEFVHKLQSQEKARQYISVH
jgi:parvulin-like peptidyl-prolyl isomerase